MDCKKNFEIKFSNKNKYNREVKFFQDSRAILQNIEEFQRFRYKTFGSNFKFK